MMAMRQALLAISLAASPGIAAAGAALPATAMQFSTTAFNGGANAWTEIVCGPILWKKLALKDLSLAQKGKAEKLEARSFSQADHTDLELFKSPATQHLWQSFSAGKNRTMTAVERGQLAALVAHPLKEVELSAKEEGVDTLLVYKEKSLLWLELSASSAAAGAPAGPAVETVYTGDRLRDPFIKTSMGGGGAIKTSAPDEFGIHSMTLRGILKDRQVDYALFTDNHAASYILRRGKLYDVKGKPVPAITGSINLKQKTAHLMAPDGDVQTFRLGEQNKD